MGGSIGMRATWYEKQGAARDVLTVGEMDDPQPQDGEVRIRIAASGINPGDVKKRQDAYGYGMPFPRIIPHSDGAGTIDAVGKGVSEEWIGRRVWRYGAQTYRPFGTAAEYTVVPLEQAVPLPEAVSFEQGACLGIPVITAHRAVHVAGSVQGKIVLVQGGAGAVGATAVQLAYRAGARLAFENFGAPLFFDWRLRECNYGARNGQPAKIVRGERLKYLDVSYPNGKSWRQDVSV